MAGTAGRGDESGIATPNSSKSQLVWMKRMARKLARRRPRRTVLPHQNTDKRSKTATTRAAATEAAEGGFLERTAGQAQRVVFLTNMSGPAKMKPSIGSWYLIMMQIAIGEWGMRLRWV